MNNETTCAMCGNYTSNKDGAPDGGCTKCNTKEPTLSLIRTTFDKLEQNMYGSAITESIIRMIIAVAFIAFLFGALAVWVLPILWEIVRPLIHTLTA